jgi:sterol 22-desaturase
VAVRDVVPKARAYVEAGNEPRCLMERWAIAIGEAAKEQGIDPQDVDCCQDDDLARTVLDFLFAAQDATNSALVYSLDVLGAHRDVLLKMRDEVEKECGNDAQDLWRHVRENGSLSYVAKVANQMLHHKPPVPMIPHLSRGPTTLNGHAIGKGTICIPSIMYSGRVGGGSLEFVPEREDADSLFVKVTTFGAGQHKCPGRRYAESLLTVFLAVLAQDFDFARVGPRPDADDFIYYPTIFPSDSNFLITRRVK